MSGIVFFIVHPYFALAPLLVFSSSTTIIFLGVSIVFLLIFSFFITAAQASFFTLDTRVIHALRSRTDVNLKRIPALMENARLFQSTLGLGKLIINILLILLLNVLLEAVFPASFLSGALIWKAWLKVPLIAAILLLFGEFMPRIRTSQHPLRSAYESSYLAELIFLLLKRVTAWLLQLSDRLEVRLNQRRQPTDQQQEVEATIRSVSRREEEQRMLTGVYKFHNITVRQVMRIRMEVSGVPYSLSFAALKKMIEELHYSRLPVYGQSLDEIKGMIHTKDVLPHLGEKEDFDWHTLLRPPFFVPEHKYIEDLLKEFQAQRIHFAIVVDEFGGTSGIITLEDIVEEIIGDIRDEFDDEESENKKLEDGSYILEGRLMLHDACLLLGIPVQTFDAVKGSSDSIAGLLLEVAGDIPRPRDTVTIGDFLFTIVEVDRNRIHKVKLVIKPRHAGQKVAQIL